MFVDILILAQLSNGPKYGYEITKNVKRIMGPTFKINNNMLYPSLKRFEKEGALVKEVVEQQGKPDRHVYSVTELGMEKLYQSIRDFTPAIAHSSVEFQVRVAFFKMLDVQTRREILLVRLGVLQSGLTHIRQVIETELMDESMFFAKRMVELQKSLAVQEMEWITSMLSEVEQ